MFCCTVCSIMFTGVYPEVVVATPCGHIFHLKCIEICLHKLKCPFCNFRIEKNQLIRLHLQVDKNWKDTATSLKSKGNSSIINLDETLNATLRIDDVDSSNNISLVENNSNDSVVEVPDLYFREDMWFRTVSEFNSKTLLTTSLSGVSLVSSVKNLLTVFNDIIPNSVIKMRLLISENKLLKMAVEEGFTNIIIINMVLGNPTALTLYDFSKNAKTTVDLISYKCLEYEKLLFKVKAPLLRVKCTKKLNESQEFMIQFFSTICKTHSKQINMEEINIVCHHSQIEITYNLAGLHLCMTSPSRNNNDILKEIIF